MIKSTNGKSQDEVLAEFDRLFAGGAYGSAQNPMAYRRNKDGENKEEDKITQKSVGEDLAADKKSRNSTKIFILLPEGIKSDEILEKLGKSLGERYLLIISSFYSRGLLKKKVKKELGNYLAGHWKILRKIGGEKYAILLKMAVMDFHHLKRSARVPVANVQSGSYALNASTLNLKHQFRYELTTVHAKHARSEHQRERQREFAAKHSVYSKIASSVDGLSFDYAAAIAYVATMPDGDAKSPLLKEQINAAKKNHRVLVLEQLALGEMPWVLDKQGRNYTVLVSVPRDIRVFFSFGGKPLWVVDVSSSQPMLHALLYPSECDEKKKYLSVVQSKSASSGFWTFMRDAAGAKHDLNDDEQKAEMKELIFRQVFFSYSEGKKGAKGVFAQAFKREFPMLWEQINAAKKKHGPKQSSGLSKAMMWVEAGGVFDAINALKHKPYPLISIHDAIVTTKEGVADVTDALSAAFVTAKLEPRLAAKLLTADA